MQWIYQDLPLEDIPENSIGCVYRITNTVSGKLYIGKKNFFSTQSRQKTVTLKTTGEKKKKKVKVTKESDWRTYYGSSDEVKKDIEILGQENFKREILELCYSKGELSYYEAKYQLIEDVLLYPDKYYNSWVSCKIHRTHLKNRIQSASKLC